MIHKLKLFLIASVLAIPLCFAAHGQQRPNIIWLMAEDIGPDLACYGMAAVKTPNLDKLAEEGLKYTRCYCSNPICSPNRSSMMVGTYQNKINAENHRSNRGVPLPEPYKPFTYWLRKAGYTTILGNPHVMGKGEKIDCNFKSTPLGSWDGKNHFGLFDKYDTITAADQPFFAQIQLAVTHRGDWWDSIRSISSHPVDPGQVELPSYLVDNPIIRLDWATYLDQIEYMDESVGRIVGELKQKGLYDNTVIIFIGDNGRGNIKGKGYLYDPGIHVPLIIHWPKGIKAGQVKNDLVSTIDITATILDLAGVKIPAYMDGKSLMNRNFHRDYVYSARDRWDEVTDRSRSLTTAKYKYIRNEMPQVPYDDHQAYIDFYRPAIHIMRKLNLENKLSDIQRPFFTQVKPSEELYDLQKDPEELHNLAGNSAFSSVLKRLRSELVDQEEKDTSTVTVQHPAPSQAPIILDWVRYYYPKAYLEMLEGKEIGYERFAKMYDKKYRKR
jgi:arylsulfatase A-like enzyme